MIVASWREIDRYRKDAGACRTLAAALLRAHADDLTDWEIAFLRGKREIIGDDELTTRQSEKLLEIRDQHQPCTEIHGFSVVKLLEGCFAGRLDLSEDDEDWLVKWHASGKSFKCRDAARLLRLARQLNLIETEDA